MFTSRIAFEQFTKVSIKFPSLCCASSVAFEKYNLHFMRLNVTVTVATTTYFSLLLPALPVCNAFTFFKHSDSKIYRKHKLLTLQKPVNVSLLHTFSFMDTTFIYYCKAFNSCIFISFAIICLHGVSTNSLSKPIFLFTMLFNLI